MIEKGNFTSDGKKKYLALPFGATWIETLNQTTWLAAGADSVVKAEWQKTNIADYYGTATIKTTATNALAPSAALTAATGFAEYDSGADNPLGTVDTGTAISGDNPPIVSVVFDEGEYNNGDIIRMTNVTGGTQLNGLDFTIGSVDHTLDEFELSYMAPIVAATNCVFYPVLYQDKFYPRTRYISAITLGTTTTIKMTVAHDFAVDDLVRLVVPQQFGTKELNSLAVKVTAITTGTITVDYDSTGFTAFTFPLTGVSIPQYAQVVPMSPAVQNDGEIGIVLQAGTGAPAGSDGDVILWKAGDDSIDIY